jgi:hypothetical protein
MCIIQGKNVNVESTSILVAPIGDSVGDPVEGDKQLTIYSNKVQLSNGDNNAMILPFPTSENVRFVNLSTMPELFSDLRYLFPYPLSRSMGLQIHDVGSYSVSIVEDLSKFAELQQDVFTIDPAVLAYLERFYSEGFSFLVCKLKPRSEYHPFGYVHDRLKNGELFIPTRHYHDDETKADWNHDIYTWNCKITQKVGASLLPYDKKTPDVVTELSKLCSLPTPSVLELRVIKRYHENHDLYAKSV